MRKFSLYRYQIPLQSGLILRAQTQRFRTGLICYLAEKHHEGWGEIAPLSGFSQESLAQAENQALAWLTCWQNGGTQTLEALFPSVAFGLSMALYELRHGLCEAKSVLTVPLCSDSSLKTIERLKQQNITIAKLKVGRYSPEQDAKTVQQLLNAMPHLSLRLDANRAWDLNTASQFALRLSPAEKRQIVFIEEPCQTVEQSLQFAKNQQIAIAWDESLQLKEVQLQIQEGLAAIVIKPMLIGSREKCLAMIKQAHLLGLQAVLSSSIESSLGLSQLAHFAEQVTPQTAAGLDTLSLMQQQLIRAFPLSSLPLYGIESSFLQKIA
ncbi:O-succinylbenzoate synthase [Bibersteinia trehalosi USDA-ARS-USMARC-188]|uniref:o-succinylbenzoate synthase n=2 Tax=Bibersteinia trehalosi TaxID=47735 RepID=A0A4V7IAN6_BIBTR|nr:o-succinylbenzoate synthase [Bibersteinia trehalosi]AGH38139.1 O-succinylbenzoate synthase [Bibersteinia trehalosi USDA-ARS-USMARC-192]AHG82059.1 O-succinylbenzoate synthase [Bibersteinia trehalosi USDA-ARS-USMARC-188]AHG84368.1 O-succinylbenzoate synthase [Bibersteinia trehalosi USDA-ARS-USMARC-189]